jgi:transcriptional regulator with XRE-family HTH domain
LAQAKKKRKRKPKPPIALDRAFGPTLRRCRKRAGYTQVVLAERSELHRTEISLLERGKRNPGYDVLIRLIGALELEDPGELLAGSSWKAPEIGKKGRYIYRDAL